nr:hypothetical protein [bacterium]
SINVGPGSRAYSLLPGRIYLNLRDREPEGSVSSTDAASILDALTDMLRSVRIPESGTPVFTDILRGTAVYSGECVDMAPDLVAVPVRGIELKSRMVPGPLFQSSQLSGMHTPDDALVWFRNGTPDTSQPGIIDMYPTILNFFALDDGTSEGNCFVHW